MIKITRGSGNVFTDLGFPPKEAETLKLKSMLVAELRKIIQREKLGHASAARHFDVKDTVVKRLTTGNFDSLSLDILVKMLLSAGTHVRLVVSTKKRGKAA